MYDNPSDNVNPLKPGVVFLYALKTSKRFSDVFRGYRKETPGCNGLIKVNVIGYFYRIKVIKSIQCQIGFTGRKVDTLFRVKRSYNFFTLTCYIYKGNCSEETCYV